MQFFFHFRDSSFHVLQLFLHSAVDPIAMHEAINGLVPSIPAVTHRTCQVPFSQCTSPSVEPMLLPWETAQRHIQPSCEQACRTRGYYTSICSDSLVTDQHSKPEVHSRCNRYVRSSPLDTALTSAVLFPNTSPSPGFTQLSGDGRPAKDRASFGCCISSNRMHTHEWQKHIWRMTWEWLGTKAGYIGVSGENGRAVIVDEGRVQRISGYERNWERGAGGLEKMMSQLPEC